MTQASTEIPRLYKEYQVNSALVAAKEQNLTAKRNALAELRNQVTQSKKELTERQCAAGFEASKLQRAVAEKNEKTAHQESILKIEQNKIFSLQHEENNMHREMSEMEVDINNMISEIQNLRADATKFPEMSEEINNLQRKFQSHAAAIQKFEDQVLAQSEKSTARFESFKAKNNNSNPSSMMQKGGGSGQQQQPTKGFFSLPTVPPTGLEDTAGESVVLLEEE